MRYFIIEGKKIGISKLWTRGAIWFFLTVMILGYVTTVYLLGRVIIYSRYTRALGSGFDIARCC